MAELGWLGIHVPEEYGGAGAGLEELAIVLEECAAAALPSPLFATVVEAGALLFLAGDEEVRRRWLPQVIGGETLLTVALQEPGLELGPTGVQARAVPQGEGYRLQGAKLFVAYAEAADQILCVARTGEAPEALSLLLVPRGAAGVHFTRLRTSNEDPQYAVDFVGVELPGSALVGAKDGAWPAVEEMLNRAAVLKCAEMAGLGQRALELTLEYVAQRVQFGQPLGKFQAVQHHCADMYRVLEQTRILAAQALWRLSNRKSATREVSLAKIKASEGIPWLLRMAHQLHGGVGYDANYPLATLYRRSIAAQGACGSARWHRQRLSRMLATDPESFRREESHPLPMPRG
jgi:alkylation response protein AidB-like acyl-CoA dehydrogenase